MRSFRDFEVPVLTSRKLCIFSLRSRDNLEVDCNFTPALQSINSHQTDTTSQTAQDTSNFIDYGASAQWSATSSQHPYIPNTGHPTEPAHTYDVNNLQNYASTTPSHHPADTAVQESTYSVDPASQYTYHSSNPIRNTHSQIHHTDTTTPGTTDPNAWAQQGAQDYPETTNITPTPQSFRPQVGSVAATQIATSIRKKDPIYFCDVPGCISQGFTTLHNFEYTENGGGDCVASSVYCYCAGSVRRSRPSVWLVRQSRKKPEKAGKHHVILLIRLEVEVAVHFCDMEVLGQVQICTVMGFPILRTRKPSQNSPPTPWSRDPATRRTPSTIPLEEVETFETPMTTGICSLLALEGWHTTSMSRKRRSIRLLR
ncbi:hypothetical protein L218DRAFT_1039111 [Marasmius fiardii PR-910]|nr:hypothetical protein L218DRAFT_1039111 [Marasmius fiardii PR-910]